MADMTASQTITPQQKIAQLKDDLEKYEAKLRYKMKFYRGVIHESAASELKHAEVMVLTAMVDDLKREIYMLEHPAARND